MIVVDKNSRNPRYLINESAVSFTENYQGVNQKGNPIYDVVAVSIVSNAAIMVYDDNNGIGYGNDLQYQRWRLNGATTGLVSAEAHNIYARLSRGDKKEADIIFSVRNYNTDGSIVQENGEKTEPSDTYYYILIGTLTALTDVNAAPTRTLTFDPGYLSSQKSNNEQGGGWISEMFDLVRGAESLIRAKLRFEDIRVKGEAIFSSIANFYSGLKIGASDSAKTITSVATDLTSKEDESEAIATPAYVKVFSEGRYLRYDIEDEQTVKGPINFESNVSVGGNHDVSGNQSIGGNSTVRGDQTINGELNITKNGTDDDKPAITIGDFLEQGDIIQGARVTKEGMASFAGIKSPTIQVYELIYNRKTAVQGEYVFSDGDTIDKVEYVTLDGTHIDSTEYDGEAYDYVLLTVRAPYEGYVTTFKPGDILYSNVNMIGASGSSAVTGKCWMYALTDDDAVDGVTIKARLYHPSACPAGVNIDPTRHMTISRHGNIVDKSRQNVFIISAEKNNLLMLRGVKSPIVDSDGMYGVVLGELPETLLKYVRETASYVSDKDPYIYARGVIVQDLIVLDYQGVPIRQEMYRGPWSEAVASGAEADRYRSTNTLYHTVTHNGSLWECMVDLTSVEPARGIAEWSEKVAKGDSSSPLYQLKPSVNVVYYHTQTKQLSVSSIDVVIGVADDSGYYNIADQYTLEQRGLSVYYTIDGVGDPRLLNISPMAEFELEDGTAIIATEDLASLGLEGESINITDATENITLYLNDIHTGKNWSTFVIPILKDGEKGDAGRMLYPAGNWDSEKTYMIENNSAPFVRHEGVYYVLVWEGSGVTGVNPAEDYAAGGTYWAPFTYMNYLFAEFLMARWAKFGGDNGGVFYERYLFSQKGTTLAGEDSSYDQHMAGDSPMFDQDGGLTYNFIPNLFLDFLTGEAKFGRITDSFTQIPSLCYEIRTGGPHNISVPKVALTKGSERFGIPTVFLPKDYEPLDGVHCSVAHELGFSSSWYEDPRNSSVFVCADKGFMGNYPADVSASTGWMMWNGYLTKFAFLAPGSMLRLRSVKNKTYGIIWHVENAEDFEIMNADMLLLKTIDVEATTGYVDLSDSTYTHLYSNPSKKRLANNNWWYKDSGRVRTDFVVICSKVYGEYSEENYDGGVGNIFPAGQFRWLFDATGREGFVRHMGRYDSGYPEFKTTD